MDNDINNDLDTYLDLDNRIDNKDSYVEPTREEIIAYHQEHKHLFKGANKKVYKEPKYIDNPFGPTSKLKRPSLAYKRKVKRDEKWRKEQYKRKMEEISSYYDEFKEYNYLCWTDIDYAKYPKEVSKDEFLRSRHFIGKKYQTKETYLNPLSIEDFLKKKDVEYNKNSLKRAIEFSYSVNKCYKKYNFARYTITLKSKRKIDSITGMERSDEEILDILKTLQSKFQSMKRYNASIDMRILSFFCTIEKGDNIGEWHIHYVPIFHVGDIKKEMSDREKTNKLYQIRLEIGEYWYRVCGRLVSRGADISVERAIEVGKDWINVDMRYPDRPYQFWYEGNNVEDMNNLIVYLAYQCKENKMVKEAREGRKHMRLCFSSFVYTRPDID